MAAQPETEPSADKVEISVQEEEAGPTGGPEGHLLAEPKEGISKARSYQENLNGVSVEEEDNHKGSMLSLPNSVGSKRKRNFMDKCVSKVRHFIKK